MQPIDVVLKLKQAKKAADKNKVLQEAWDAECYEFFEGIHLALNPIMQFSLDAVPKIVEEDDEPDDLGFSKFRHLALEIFYDRIKAPMPHIEEALNTSSVVAWNEWYRKILLKSFGNLVTVSQINKFLQSVEDEDLLIPTFKHQKAQSSYLRRYPPGEYFIDGYVEGERLITVLRRVPRSFFFFDKKGKPINYNDLAVIEDLIDLIPVDIVFDGVYSEGRYHVFDVMPYDEYRKGSVNRTLEERHAALCDMQDAFTDLFGAKIRILPKKKVTVTVTSDTGLSKKEFREQGFTGIVFKKAEGGYFTGYANANWRIETVDRF